jgi:23S rRNA (adenine2503-C2)-methyltransferase
MGCVFCASYNPKISRNLSAGEILWELLTAKKDSGLDISNIVLMGIGEPLDNYDNVMRFLSVVSSPGGLNIGMRHISLSTCGLVPQIDKLAEKNLQLTLSVSLHAPNNQTRDKIMPINRKYPVEELIDTCKRYFNKTHRRISFEYAMIKNVNDSISCANQLADLLSGLICHVNLIPLNKNSKSSLLPSDQKTINNFKDTLEKKRINVTVRRRLGSDIDAACGQLKAKNNL